MKQKKIKNMNYKMTTTSQLSTIEPKEQNKLSKQLEHEQNHRNGDHMEGYQQVGWGGWRGKVEGMRSITDRYKIGGG